MKKNGNEKVVVKKECHSRGMLSGIYNACCYDKEGKILLNRYVEDLRLKPSGMTSLNTPSPRCWRTRPLPQGARRTARGFTLIELLVVVLIIGILAAVAVPQYQKAVAKSRLATIKSLVESVVAAEEVYYLANGKYTNDVEDLDVSLPGGWTEGENQETDGVITKRQYVFNWGKCNINATQFTCSVDISNVLVYYKKYYEHAANSPKRRCIVWSTDLGHIGNKLCKNETQKAKPDHPKNPVEYVEWWYE